MNKIIITLIIFAIIYIIFSSKKESFRQTIITNKDSAQSLVYYYQRDIQPYMTPEFRNNPEKFPDVWEKLWDTFYRLGFTNRSDDLFSLEKAYLNAIKERTKVEVKEIVEKKKCSQLSCYFLQSNKDILCSSNQCLKSTLGNNVLYNNISKESCSTLCNGNTNCKGFVHYTKEKKCWLLSGTNNPVNKTGSQLYMKIEETNLPPYSDIEIKSTEPNQVYVNDKIKFTASDYITYYQKNIEKFQTQELLTNPSKFGSLYDTLINRYEYLGVINSSDDLNILKRNLEGLIQQQLQNDIDFVTKQNLQREMIMANVVWFNMQQQKNYWIQNSDQVAAARAIQNIQDSEMELYQAKLKRGKDPGAFLNFWKGVGRTFVGVVVGLYDSTVSAILITYSILGSITTGQGIINPPDFFKKVGCLGVVVRSTEVRMRKILSGSVPMGASLSLASGVTGLDETRLELAIDPEGTTMNALRENLC